MEKKKISVLRWIGSETTGVEGPGLGQLCSGDLSMFSWIPLDFGLSISALRPTSLTVLQNV